MLVTKTLRAENVLSEVSMELGRKLGLLRADKNVSQERVAEAVGVSRQSVAKWEAGDSLPELEKLVLLSRYFGVTLDFLVKDEEDCGTRLTKQLPSSNSEVVGFLCRAKKATYAGHGQEVTSSRTSSRDLEYTEGPLKYYDTYLGSECFSGSEAVWKEGRAIWSMNYCGRVLYEEFSGDFLKDALRRVSEESPFRGPPLFQNGDLTYHCRVEGTFDWFSGIEGIFYQEKMVYECRFHGGAVK